MRLQLALNVKDLEAAIDFYSKMFGAPVNKRRPGYANFAIDSPPLKLVLFELPDAPERLNHLGVEVFDDEDVSAATEPDGLRWEWYRVLEDSKSFFEEKPEPKPGAAEPCC